VHALTGCDTTAIFGIGKKSVFKLIKSSSAELSDLSELKDPDLESSICVARKVVAKLYDPGSSQDVLFKCRFTWWNASKEAVFAGSKSDK
jgi:hypothetical protein